jgi:hypothetical protein
MNKDIRVVRLLTGEEIIAEVSQPGELSLRKVWILNKPIRIIVVPSETERGKATIDFMDFVQNYADSTAGVEIKDDHVLFTLPPSRQLKDNYVKITSKIMTAAPGLIIPQ